MVRWEWEMEFLKRSVAEPTLQNKNIVFFDTDVLFVNTVSPVFYLGTDDATGPELPVNLVLLRYATE